MRTVISWMLEKYEKSKLVKIIGRLEDLSSGLSVIIFTNTLNAGCHLKILHRGRDVTKDTLVKLHGKEASLFPKLSKGYLSDQTGSLVLWQVSASDKEWVGLELAELFKSYPVFYQRGRVDQVRSNWRTTGLDTKTIWFTNKSSDDVYKELLRTTDPRFIESLKNKLTKV